jgi:hypothetical protein
MRGTASAGHARRNHVVARESSCERDRRRRSELSHAMFVCFPGKERQARWRRCRVRMFHKHADRGGFGGRSDVVWE